MWPNTLTEIEENPFLLSEEPIIVILPLLQKVGDRLPDAFIIALWNGGSHKITLKRNTTIGYVKESDYIEKHIIEQPDYITEVTEISIHPDLRPKTAFTCPYGKFQWM